MSGRRNKGGGGHGEGGEERWLLPYADMITLLLGLFIVLFAMSSIDAKQFDHVRRSLSQTFRGDVLENPGGVLDGASGVLDPEAANQTSDSSAVARVQEATDAAAAKYERQAHEVEQLATQAGLGNDVRVTNNQRGIVVNLAGDALFDSGSAELRPAVREGLTKLERKLQAFGHPIEIAGHTDGQPFPGPGGNWALSADRAQAVLLFFLEQGFPAELMEARYHADTRPLVKPRGKPHAAVAKNRRIEITVLAPGANDPTPEVLKLAAAAAGPGAAHGRDPRPLDEDLAAELDIVTELATTSRGLR